MKYLLFVLMILFAISSCSDDDSEQADPIVGMWFGTSFQPDFGTSEITITVSQLVEEETAAQLFGEVTDISDCDNDLFFCELGSCSTTWIYKGRSGSVYLFFEDAGSSDCGDGNVSAQLTSNGDLNYTWTDITDATNTSSAILQRVN